MELRDKNGLTEEEFLKQYNADKYPRPSVTADICIFAEDDGELELLLVKRGGHPFLGRWATPGGFANANEPLEQTAARELQEETGISGVPLRHVGVYSRPGRDPRGWTISSAYTALVRKSQVHPEAGDDAAEVSWFRVKYCRLETGIFSEITLQNGVETLHVLPDQGDLAFDHAEIIRDSLLEIVK